MRNNFISEMGTINLPSLAIAVAQYVLSLISINTKTQMNIFWSFMDATEVKMVYGTGSRIFGRLLEAKI
jgi:hypothetical protein